MKVVRVHTPSGDMLLSDYLKTFRPAVAPAPVAPAPAEPAETPAAQVKRSVTGTPYEPAQAANGYAYVIRSLRGREGARPAGTLALLAANTVAHLATRYHRRGGRL